MKTRRIILPLTIALLLSCCLTGCGTTKVNLNKYAAVSYDGYNGHGSASVDVDFTSLMEDYGDKLKVPEDYKDWGTDEEVIEYLLGMNIECTVDTGDAEQGKLSNGDTVTMEWTVSDELGDALTAEFTYESEEFTVSDLEEVEQIDGFSGVTVTFDGTAPSGTATLDTTSAPLSTGAYTLDVSSGLSNGDVVTVTISESYANDFAASEGKYPAELTKEFTVEGLTSYVTALDEIPEDAMTKMEKESVDSMEANAADYDEAITIKSRTHIGNYFLTAKNDTTWGDQNQIYLIYEVQAEQNGTELTYYTYRKFSDLLLLADGTCSLDYSNYEYPSYNWLMGGEGFSFTDESGEELYYAGYEDLDSMFNNLVTAQIDEYTYENTVPAE